MNNEHDRKWMGNVEHRLINLFLDRGVSLVQMWGSITFGGERPHIHKLVFSNMGSTLRSSPPRWSLYGAIAA